MRTYNADDLAGRWVTYGEAAELTGRSARTIRRWVKDGRLVTFQHRINRKQLLQVEARMRRARRAGIKADEL
ncbi:helix-turn-helix domain-containing protein [Brevibacterium gallinarum]|uniref:Helix-turn-helix domain-containing protein n=1 Tax=Brevibacterium gallinarum TaxID=2762220 RepID=A0ABR8WRK2_9MICO|nr:helix-turn-helix domain-containing protein [Brevibacterium gallinarum]MBD8019376.1 helix-turn-helix domain-containing protein [Brevibacterium gallinarum]